MFDVRVSDSTYSVDRKYDAELACYDALMRY